MRVARDYSPNRFVLNRYLVSGIHLPAIETEMKTAVTVAVTSSETAATATTVVIPISKAALVTAVKTASGTLEALGPVTKWKTRGVTGTGVETREVKTVAAAPTGRVTTSHHEKITTGRIVTVITAGLAVTIMTILLSLSEIASRRILETEMTTIQVIFTYNHWNTVTCFFN